MPVGIHERARGQERTGSAVLGGREGRREGGRKRERGGERERYKDRERERESERERKREREREREREGGRERETLPPEMIGLTASARRAAASARRAEPPGLRFRG